MLGTGLVLAMFALAAPIAPAPARGPAIAPAPATGGPAAALQALGRAYSDRSPEGVGALLTGDFRFHTTDARIVPHFPDGIARDHELQVFSGLIHGVTHDGQVVMPAADSIKVTLDGLTEGPDPEHPDSTGHYRLVAVQRFKFDIRLPDDRTFRSTPALHVFHLVRGDAAVRVAGQPGDADRWYIRRWLEDVDALVVALGDRKGDCDEPGPQPVRPDSAERGGPPTGAGPVVPLALAIHPLGNPACPTLDIVCDLPGVEPARLDVYDVMGRLMNHLDFAVSAPGARKIQAGAGAHLAPGVYWVALSQAARRPSTRMVVVAR